MTVKMPMLSVALEQRTGRASEDLVKNLIGLYRIEGGGGMKLGGWEC